MKMLPSGYGSEDLSYGTYLGGGGSDKALAITVGTDLPGTVYVTGTTQSQNFPVTNGTLRHSCSLPSHSQRHSQRLPGRNPAGSVHARDAARLFDLPRRNAVGHGAGGLARGSRSRVSRRRRHVLGFSMAVQFAAVHRRHRRIRRGTRPFVRGKRVTDRVHAARRHLAAPA